MLTFTSWSGKTWYRWMAFGGNQWQVNRRHRTRLAEGPWNGFNALLSPTWNSAQFAKEDPSMFILQNLINYIAHPEVKEYQPTMKQAFLGSLWFFIPFPSVDRIGIIFKIWFIDIVKLWVNECNSVFSGMQYFPNVPRREKKNLFKFSYKNTRWSVFQ